MNRRAFLSYTAATLGGAALLASYPVWIERGIVMVDTYRVPVPRLPKAFEGFRIVLAHNPDTADTAYEAPVDFMISGHTHGGQVRIPFFGSPILPVRNKTYSQGVKQTPKKYPIFISRGIGWSILPIRFNCYPEIAVLELVSGSA